MTPFTAFGVTNCQSTLTRAQNVLIRCGIACGVDNNRDNDYIIIIIIMVMNLIFYRVLL